MLHPPALGRDPLLQLPLTSGAAMQMLMRNLGPFLYSEVPGEPDSLQSFGYLREGGLYKMRKKSKVHYTPAQRLLKNLN